MTITIQKLTDPTPEIAAVLEGWSNDPALVPFIRPSKDRQALEKKVSVTVETLQERLVHQTIYLITWDDKLVGEMNFMVDPSHLHQKVPDTAWIGILIGDEEARGRGIGTRAMQHLEDEIRDAGLRRIELGVFEFNRGALQLYRKLGYQEIGRIPDFTYWQGRLWEDIRMEKWLQRRRAPDEGPDRE